MDREILETLRMVRQTRSFAGAARALDLDPSAVSRTVSAVEASLGVRLFERSTRRMAETEAGQVFLDRVLPLAQEFDAARDAARGLQNAPSGELRMTGSVAFCQTCIVPHLAAFRRQYPDIQITLLPTDRVVDLVAHRMDLAIRLGPTPTGDVICSRLFGTRYHVVAAPGWIAEHVAILHPKDLENHAVLRFDLPDFRTGWQFRKAQGDPIAVAVQGDIVIGNALGLRQAARDGLGPVLLADWLVRSDLERGSLVALLPEWEVSATAFDTAAWAVYPSRRYVPGKVRAAIDFFRDVLA